MNELKRILIENDLDDVLNEMRRSLDMKSPIRFKIYSNIAKDIIYGLPLDECEAQQRLYDSLVQIAKYSGYVC